MAYDEGLHNPEWRASILKQAGINYPEETNADPFINQDRWELLPLLKERIQQILHIINDEPMKSTDVFSLIMYDIEDDKVRTAISKYLIEKGCIRIQKSVYILKAHHRVYKEIVRALKEVQSSYDNQDSIIFVPVPPTVPGSMQIIGKEVHIDRLLNDPNVLFF